MEADELIVSGGGAKNKFFLAALQDYFLGGVVRTVEQLGMASEAKEATCFAILANETIAGRTANVPAVTGARKSVVLGKICLG
jgi:anhydro-N-acetylmuramic acid kinase